MTAQTILPANTLSSDYDVANSLRFDKPSDSYLEKTFSSAGSTRKFTFSTWLKGHETSVHGSTYFFVGNINGSSNIDAIGITNTGIQISINSANSGSLNSTALFRDMSAWYHFVIGVDTTQGTASNRVKVYINGVQITAWDTETYPSQNYDFTGINSTEVHNVSYASSEHNGYLCETVFIDGTQLDPTSFGKFDSTSPTIWKPKDVSGLTFGQNGFYLEYKGVSTGQNSNGLGADTSGNDHHFASSGLAAHDQSTDTCTNNFATLNPLIYESRDNTFAEGNLKITGGNADDWTNKYGVSSIAVSSGKWFVEAKATTMVTSQGVLGIMGTSTPLAGSMRDNGPANIDSGGRISGGGGDHQTGLTNFADGNIAGVAFDADNGTIQFYRNGSTYGNAVSSIASDTYYFVTNSYEQGAVVEFNFGSPPYSESGGNSDANGYGNFSMAVPNGYFALNTKNLAEYG
jgi:hypothetical protein